MISLVCSGCGKKLRVKEELAGKRVKCPHCGQVVPVSIEPSSAVTEAKTQVGGRITPGCGAALAPPAPGSPTEAPTLPPADAAGPEPRHDTLSDPTRPAGEGGAGSAGAGELTDFLAPPRSPDELGWLGPYRVLKVLGCGGMGVVFQAEDPHLQRRLALKVMLPALAASESARQRFLREARSAAAIEHDHIVSIYQVGEDRGVPFLAMPFLNGEALDIRLQREPRLPVREVLRIGREMADGLAAAHDQGLIHRDIKPANVWLEGDRGRVKILDFGLARSAGDQAGLTQPGAIIGTPAYMAPEQGLGKGVDARSDLFSLGCVLYQLCTGELPFKGTDTISTLMAVATHEPPPPQDLNPVVPSALNSLVMWLLAKDPAARPASARTVVEQIQEIEADRTCVEDPSPARRQRKAIAGKKAPQTGAAPAARKRQLWLNGGLAGAVLAALGLVVVLLVSQVGPPPNKDGEKKEGKKEKKGANNQEKGGIGPRVPATVPLCRGALVSNPAPIPGVQSWSIELPAHRGAIRAVVYSPDGRWLATAGDDGIIRLREADSGKLVRLLMGHAGRINALAWLSDRKKALLASGGIDKMVRLWDAATGKLLRAITQPAAVYSVAWLGEGTVMAKLTAPEDSIHVWDAYTGKIKQKYKGELTVKLTAFRWSPDGKLLATAHPNNKAKLWDAAAGKFLRDLQGPAARVTSLAWSADGNALAGGDVKQNIHVWNVATGRAWRPPLKTNYREPTHTLAWSPNRKKLATGAGQGEWGQVWNLDTGKPGPGVSQPRGLLRALDWSPDGKILAGGAEQGTLVRWQAASGKTLFSPGGRGIDWARGISWSPDGQRLAFAQGAPVAIWDPGSGKFLHIGGTSNMVNSCFGVQWSPDGKMLALLRNKLYHVYLSDPDTGKFLRPLTGHTNHPQAAAWSPDSTKVASSAQLSGPRLLIHDAASGKLVASSPPGRPVRAVGALAWSPNGKILASNGVMAGAGRQKPIGDGASLLFWDVAVKVLLPRALPGHKGGITVLAWSPKGTLLASGSHDKTIRLWNAEGKPVGSPLNDHQARITALRWLAEDRLISLDSGGVACFWDLRDGRARRSIKGLPGGGVISPDGRMLAAPLFNAARVWDMDKAKPLGTFLLLRMGRPILWLALSPDGHYRGSTGVEKEIVYVVRTAWGQEIFTAAEFGRKFSWKNEPERVSVRR